MESSLEQFIKAADAFPVAILIADVEGRIVRVNQKTETMFGYQRDELISQTIETLKPETLSRPSCAPSTGLQPGSLYSTDGIGAGSGRTAEKWRRVFH